MTFKMEAHTSDYVLFLIILNFKLIKLFALCFLSSPLQAFLKADFIFSFESNIITSST